MTAVLMGWLSAPCRSLAARAVLSAGIYGFSRWRAAVVALAGFMRAGRAARFAALLLDRSIAPRMGALPAARIHSGLVRCSALISVDRAPLANSAGCLDLPSLPVLFARRSTSADPPDAGCGCLTLASVGVAVALPSAPSSSALHSACPLVLCIRRVCGNLGRLGTLCTRRSWVTDALGLRAARRHTPSATSPARSGQAPRAPSMSTAEEVLEDPRSPPPPGGVQASGQHQRGNPEASPRPNFAALWFCAFGRLRGRRRARSGGRVCERAYRRVRSDNFLTAKQLRRRGQARHRGASRRSDTSWATSTNRARVRRRKQSACPDQSRDSRSTARDRLVPKTCGRSIRHPGVPRLSTLILALRSVDQLRLDDIIPPLVTHPPVVPRGGDSARVPLHAMSSSGT